MRWFNSFDENPWLCEQFELDDSISEMSFFSIFASGVICSAVDDGVGARRSATKSDIVKSDS